MPELVSPLAILARSLLPLAKTVSNHCKRLHKERRAAQSRLELSTDIVDGILNQTLDRLRGGSIDDHWWKGVLNRIGQEYIAPDSLKSSIWHKWLSDTSVADNLKLLAKAEIMGNDQDPEVRTFLAQSYPDRTYEIYRLEFEPVDVVVAILVAGYINSIPNDQLPLAGMVQGLQINIYEGFKELKREQSENVSNPITQKAHTQYAKRELSKILTLRIFNPSKSRSDIQKLIDQVLEGGLRATTLPTKTKILFWGARLFAQDKETLPLAKEICAKLKQIDTDTELSIIDALILEKKGQVEKALRLIRDYEDPDSRSVFFSILARSQNNQDALDWFDNRNGYDDKNFFTAVGWINLALSLVKVGRWEEALKPLVKLESLWEKSPMLSLVEGHLNAVMLLPEDFRKSALDTIPLHKGISPVLGVKAKSYHNRAITCFNSAEQNLKEIVDNELMEFIADWQLWLQLMDPSDTEAILTRNEISKNMQDGKDAVGLMRFTWSFKIQFDEKPLREYLEERKQFVGLNDREILAEFFLFEQSTNFRELVNYIEQHEEPLSRVLSSASLTCLHIEALVKDEQTQKAHKILRDNRTNLGDVVSSRLTILINSFEGNDPRKELEDLYNQTGELIDLYNLIDHLKKVDDRVELLPLLQELFRLKKNVENAKDLIKCLGDPPFFDYWGIIKFLNDNQDILEQSDDLKELKAWALFEVSRFEESKTINDILLSRRKNLADLVRDIDIAIALGEWERIPEIFNREWSQRDSHRPEMLMSLAQLVSDHGQNTDRALKFAKLAAEKAPKDPNILAAAYYLHVQLGREDKADPDWLVQALKLSSPDEGPLWSSDLTRMVKEIIPERQDHLRMVERKWINGEIPTIIAAKVFGQPLVRLFFQIARQNMDEPDGRRRTMIPIISCVHLTVRLDEKQTIGLDITSIMVLWYLDLLEKTLTAFQHVKLAPNIMTLLMWEKHMVRFHQPSLIKDAKQVRELVKKNRLRTVSDFATPPQTIINEVGLDLGGLLQAAREKNGKVVCVLPIHKAGSLTGEKADIEEYNDLIISTVDFCALLHKDGKIESSLYNQAITLLRSQKQSEYTNTHTSILSHPIYIDDLALYYLQSAKVLEAACSCGLDIRIHPYVLENKDILIQEEDTGDDLSREIEKIRDTLRNALESGAASFLPSTIHNTAQEEHRTKDDIQVQAIASLLGSCTEYDVLCADDCFLNHQLPFKGSAKQEVPIACTLDIIRYLVSREIINEDVQWIVRHRLRHGGFATIPLETDELMYWIKNAVFDKTGLKESLEIRILRQSMARAHNLGMFNLSNNFTTQYAISSNCTTAIHRLWQEESLTTEQKRILSYWIWYHLITLAFIHQHIDKPTRTKFIEELMPRCLAVLLSPSDYDLPQEQRADYVEWIEQSVLQPIRLTNPYIIKKAIEIVCQTISAVKDKQDQNICAYFFLKYAPKSLHDLVYKLEPEFVKDMYPAFGRTFNFGSDIQLTDNDLFPAVREILSKKKTKHTFKTDRRNVSISLDPEDGNVVLEWSEVDLPSQKLKIAWLALFSPEREIRVLTLQDIVNQFGPTTPDFQPLLQTIEKRELKDNELLEILDEMTNGVVSIQANLISKINKGFGVTVMNIVPQFLSYFERFCGPAPKVQEPERYINEVLVPYRKELLNRDLQKGLDICCLGSLRDDLSPGQWVEKIDNDSLWEALSSCNVESDPFSLLGALDIALYRQDDKRFREFSLMAVNKLANGKFGQVDGIDTSVLFNAFANLILNRISLLDNGASYPAYWKRMCAFMQAGLITRAFVKLSHKTNMDFLPEWVLSNLRIAGFYSNLISSRKEPMLLLWQIPLKTFQGEIIGQLAALKSRHKKEGHKFPKSENLDLLLAQMAQDGIPRLRGPLEGHIRPEKPIPQKVMETLKRQKTEDSDSFPWSALATASNFFTLGNVEMENVKQEVKRIAENVANSDLEKNLFSLELASFVAAVHMDSVLADEISNAVVRSATKISGKEQVVKILKILFQSATAYENENTWSKWLEERLAIIAQNIPNNFLELFVQHLDEISVVLPINLWVHIPARSIASSGK